jgi:hypothetical protein
MIRFRALALLLLAGAAPSAARQVNLPTLLNLHGDFAPVRYSPGALDRAAHVQARLEALAMDFSRWGTQPYVLQGYVLAPEDWAAAGLRWPYGLPERSGARGLAVPAWGDEDSVALWRRLLGGPLPWTGDLPVRGTPEEAASLSLSDVVLQVESARLFVESEKLGGDAPWIADLAAHAVALQAFGSHEAGRLEEIAGVWAHLGGVQPGLAACNASADWATNLACDARFASGARILFAEDRMKTVRRLQKLARKRGLSEASLVAEYPPLAAWLADGRR